MPAPLSVLALNVATPTLERATALLERFWPDEDDVWVLTETSAGEGTGLLTRVCRAAGHEVHLTRAADGGGRGVLVVGRGCHLEREEVAPPEVLPGRVLPLRLRAEGRPDLRLAGVYGAASDPVRYASAAQRERKRAWLRAFDAWVVRWRALDPETPALLLGDLNLVDPGHADPLPYVLAEETAALQALTDTHGLVDAWRSRHPASAEVSWADHSGVGCRYDHAFVSPELDPTVLSCELVQELRTTGLSDHAGLRITLA